jgi:ribosomal protein L37E
MQARTYAIIVAIITLAALASLTASEARSDITVTVEFSGMECVGVAAITPYPGKLQLTGQRIYTVSVGNLTSGDVVSLEVVLSDLKRCRVESVSGALAWFIDRDKLYANIMLKEGENKVYVKFSYTPPKRVYATVNATNPECVAELTANAPVNKVSGGWVVGPWTDGDMAELSATPSDRCYIGGWMSGVKALTTSSFYSFQASENITLTLSAERRGTMPPPSLIDFSIVSVRATGPGKVVVSPKPITTGVGTPLWQAVLNPGTTIYVEAVPEGCGEFRGWRGTDKLKTVDTPSLTIITDPGYLDVEAVFENMKQCPYIVIGPYRILRVDDVPIVAAVVGGGSTCLLVYRMVRAGRRQRRTLDELMPRWSDEMLSSIASYTTGHPYAMIANLVREYRPPETPTEYIYIFRAYRDGRLSDILRDLDRCDSASTVLFTISEYRMVRLRYASEQGYMAGRLLTAYISLEGYAPVTRNILYEWVRRMLAVSSREDAEHNIELLWRDKQLVNLQKNAVEEVIRELSKEGLENLAINPPKPFQKILETLIKCPRCSNQPSYGEKYCKQCGTRIPTKAWKITEETHKPITVEIEQKAGTPTIECPRCGKALPPHAKYCTKCGSSIVSPAREGGRIREVFRRIQQDVSRKTTPEKPAPELEREVSPESAEKTSPPAFKEPIESEEKPSQAEGHVKPTVEKPAAEREPRTLTGSGEKPQPQQPALPTRRVTVAEPVPTKVDWEPAKWILDELEGLGVEPEEFKAVVEQVAYEDPDMGSYRAASVLAESMEFANDYEKASFITNVAALIPYAVNEYLAIVEQAKEREEKGGRESTTDRQVEKYEQAETEQPGELKPPEDESKISLDELLKNGAEPGTLYILDPRYVRAPTLPTAVAAKLLEKLRPVPLEEAEVINLSEVYVLTQGMTTSKLKIRRVKADPIYPPLDKLVHTIKAGAACITVKGIYEILPVRAKNVMKVTLDRQVEEAYRRLLELMDEKDARRLEGFEALMPGVIQAALEGRLEEYLKASYGLDGELRELLVDAVTVALDREKSKRSWIRNILMAFGVVE